MRSNVSSLSIKKGGVQTLSLDAGVEYAGFKYLIVGTRSGTFPGTTQAGLQVPLNYDKYTRSMLENPGQVMYKKFSGYLDSKGKAEAKLDMPAGLSFGRSGAVYHHAAILIDPKTKRIKATTNPVELLLM